jgi:hypothetical protein
MTEHGNILSTMLSFGQRSTFAQAMEVLNLILPTSLLSSLYKPISRDQSVALGLS